MLRLIIVTLLLALACMVQAANVTYYSYPTVKRLYDNSRVLIYANASGSRNITGAQLKSEIVTQSAVNAAIATPTNATPLTVQAGPGDTDYTRKIEVKDKTGKITYYVTASGKMVFGTPKALAVSSVYPANGTSGVSNGTWFNYTTLGLGWKRINTTTPSVTYNKSVGVGLSTQYIVGMSNVPSGTDVTWSFGNFSGVPGMSYTIKVVRQNIPQTDGETTSSCGSAMVDVGGVCQATFTMAP